ncbi:uncharacterized protein LOC110886329 [Helianthus annuus]|uniref:uncharacterized protein LOC110886329 n=1 Tax=Helianthus annuus TaxID=4232 RepID=UPI001652CFFD|nr:uncharacterized protein LOC110886329 [Helianthus annuus]
MYYYYNMLSAKYREFMTPSKYETLTEIINTAREREIELKKQVKRGQRRAQDVNPSPTKKARTAESGKKVETKGGLPSCKVCGKGHKGECRFKDKPCPVCRKTGHTASLCPGNVSVCYKCYQPGHKKSECPELVGKRDTKESPAKAPKAKARSFQLSAAEAKTEPDVLSDVNGLKRKLLRKLSADDDNHRTNWEVGECIGSWWKSDLETLPYDMPSSGKIPKECTKLYLVKLPSNRDIIVPENFKLLAIPICQLHENRKVLDLET